MHRERLCRAMAEAMVEKGYVGTSVEDVLKRAGVSRLSFYRLFDSKLDCFMTALEYSTELLLGRVAQALGRSGGGDPVERYERAVTGYLDALKEEWPAARLCLVEVYAAGPEAVARRGELQETMTAVHADVLGATGEQGLLACRMLSAATGALVSGPVAQNDREGLDAVRLQLIAHVRALWGSGVFGAGAG
ncbi:hypothetical protein GCM10009550_34540 [Actinocorallia libanotica]|uniref:HTH tetR-type domain-containing protein n=1 Tax=Actinocorallia libanotica TaxID=46162 RepID=A0ABP4BR45_9ACTN